VHNARSISQHDLSDVARPVVITPIESTQLAVRLVVGRRRALRPTSWHLWRGSPRVCALSTIQNWVEAGGKKGRKGADGSTFLDWALENFSGYVLSMNSMRPSWSCRPSIEYRILYEVLDHDPCHDDIDAFLGRLKAALDERNLALKGITTDGSALYPEPIRTVFGSPPSAVVPSMLSRN